MLGNSRVFALQDLDCLDQIEAGRQQNRLANDARPLFVVLVRFARTWPMQRIGAQQRQSRRQYPSALRWRLQRRSDGVRSLFLFPPPARRRKAVQPPYDAPPHHVIGDLDVIPRHRPDEDGRIDLDRIMASKPSQLDAFIRARERPEIGWVGHMAARNIVEQHGAGPAANGQSIHSFTDLFVSFVSFSRRSARD
jgi:hypothetical protein